MTNEPGRSEGPVVPEKSLNHAGQSAREGREGRGLAKGKLLLQNASRTPSLRDAPPARERVRQAAKEDKKLRFTALLHHLYHVETLRMAYLALKKEAAPGEDAERMRKFDLELPVEKTRLLEFARFAIDYRPRRGEGKPETCNFLGCTPIGVKKRSNGM
jgi:hypothetical protein